MKLVPFDESYIPEFQSWFIESHPDNKFIHSYIDPIHWLKLVHDHPNRYGLAAIIDGRLVGFADIEFDDEGNASFAFGIAPKFRGRGFGAKLLNEVIKFAKAHSAKTILGGVDKENTTSQYVLEKAGFSRVTEDDEVYEFIKQI